ncbi:MAG: hypothetical protein VXU42_05125, partial [Verrucomicrobiota bacterium]|nr:hypothetical protein [Verrucomicrobiota bacterium]
MNDEFDKLGKKGTWDISGVQARADVSRWAKRDGERANFGRIFGICSIKGSELPVGHKDRKYKGRFVFDGREGAVRDEYNEASVYNNQGSSPATIESSKMVDAYSLMPGNEGEDGDAEQAYVQADIEGNWWASLPVEYW